MATLRSVGAVMMSLVAGLVAASGRPARAQECAPIAIAQFGIGSRVADEDSTWIRSVVPHLVAARFAVVLYADTLDLDCDGAVDVVVEAKRRGEARSVFAAFVRRGPGWRQVLATAVVVDGLEQIAVAAPVVSHGRRDLLTVGEDEGGVVPRLFRWKGESYAEVALPRIYHVRQESDWTVVCRSSLNPGIAGRRIVLLRETISPSATLGHGTSCELPRDTLEVRRDVVRKVGTRR